MDPTVPVNWSDGLSVAEIRGHDGLIWTITSPNMDFVPQPFAGVIRVSLMSDGRYGAVDPVQYPQLLGSDFVFLSAIYRRAPDDHPYHPMWTVPLESSHFEYSTGSAIRCLGLLSNNFVDPMSALVDTTVDQVRRHVSQSTDRDIRILRWLESSMRHARDRLRTFASTFRDAVLQCAQLQRYWLMCQAFLLFEQLVHHTFSSYNAAAAPTRHNLMGAFTASPDVVQTLFHAGIPVWFLRPKTALPPSVQLFSLQETRPPSSICTTPMDSQGGAVYHGIAGNQHIQTTCRSINLYHDITQTPLLLVEDGDHYAAMPQRQYKKLTTVTAASKARDPSSVACSISRHSRTYHPYPRVDSSHTRGRDKFTDVSHEWMPPPVPPWENAMRVVAHNNRIGPAKPSTETWGYWIPEPSLLLNSQSRRERYLHNWLRARHGWLYLLRVRGSAPTRVPPQWWRDFLYSTTSATSPSQEGSSRKAKRKAMISHVFGGVFQDSDINLASCSPVAWFHHRIDALTSDISPLIIWEMFELGFRYELLALDQYLVPVTSDEITEALREDLLSAVFPNGGIYALETLPSEGTGICAPLIDRRIPALEALRRVIVRWPGCPSHVQTSQLGLHVDRHQVLRMEEDIALFYVTTFFEHGGRAPLIPHEHPMCSIDHVTA